MTAQGFELQGSITSVRRRGRSITTGQQGLDQTLGGIPPGGLWSIIHSRHGREEAGLAHDVALQIAGHAAGLGERVVVITVLEHTDQTELELVQAVSDVPWGALLGETGADDLTGAVLAEAFADVNVAVHGLDKDLSAVLAEVLSEVESVDLLVLVGADRMSGIMAQALPQWRPWLTHVDLATQLLTLARTTDTAVLAACAREDSQNFDSSSDEVLRVIPSRGSSHEKYLRPDWPGEVLFPYVRGGAAHRWCQAIERADGSGWALLRGPAEHESRLGHVRLRARTLELAKDSADDLTSAHLDRHHSERELIKLIGTVTQIRVSQADPGDEWVTLSTDTQFAANLDVVVSSSVWDVMVEVSRAAIVGDVIHVIGILRDVENRAGVVDALEICVPSGVAPAWLGS